MDIKVDPNNYLEGNRDGNSREEYLEQVSGDEKKAARIAKEMEKIYKEYEQREDILKYLTDGAILMCDQACLTPFTMKDGTVIEIKYSKEETKGYGKEKKRLYTKLHVKDTKMLSGPALQATTVDSKKYENIPPFKCNCKLMDDRQKETDAIYKYLNSQKSREKIQREIFV